MDIPELISLFAITPWIWIIAKFLILGDLYDLIPLLIFGYLLYLVHLAYKKYQQEIKDALKVENQRIKDGFCQTDEQKIDAKSEEIVTEKLDGSTQTSTQCCETFTQTYLLRKDSSTQTETCQLREKSTETEKPIMYDNKETQTSPGLLLEKKMELARSESETIAVKTTVEKRCENAPLPKETQTSPGQLLEKVVRTEIHHKSSEIFESAKKPKSDTSNPLTKAFLKFHERRRKKKQNKITFVPKVDKIAEFFENGCEEDSWEYKETSSEVQQIPSTVFVPVTKMKPKPNIPPTKEFLMYHQNRHKEQREDFKFLPVLETIYEDVENEIEELESDTPTVETTEKNSAKSSPPPEQSSICVESDAAVVESEVKSKTKKKKTSVFKRKFSSLKKFFKK